MDYEVFLYLCLIFCIAMALLAGVAICGVSRKRDDLELNVKA